MTGKIIVECFLSLNGVIDKPWEWIGNYFTNEHKEHSIKTLKKTDVFLLGRKTYEKFSAAWININGEEYFDRINAMPKLVASGTLATAGWNAGIVSNDVLEQLTALKQSGKSMLSYGFGELQHLLIQAGVIDEIRFSVIPVTVNSAKHLFDGHDMSTIHFKLVDSFTFSNGVQSITYQPLLSAGVKNER